MSRFSVLLGVLGLSLGLAAPAAAGQLERRGDAGTRALWGSLTAAEARGALRGASIRPERYRPFELAEGGLAVAFDRDELVLSLPHPDGGFQRFALEETPVLAPGLAAKHPEIKTFTGTGIDDPAASVHADLTPLGFHASVRSPEGAWYVDPSHHLGDDGVYLSYHGRDLENVRGPLVEPREIEEMAHSVSSAVEGAGPAVTRRVYRLALVSDPSYFTYFENIDVNVTAAKVTLVSRVSQVYETETAIRLVLADENDALNLNTAALATGTNGPCGAAACYTVDELATCDVPTLTRTRIVIGQLVGASNYDVGHIVLGKNGGGIAWLPSAGLREKAYGCTGLPQPVGDFFAVDYVAHELGHQFAANHTFNGIHWGCSGGNRNQQTSVEPGSGSSIMAYAGICRENAANDDNLQPHTDAYWSQRSRQEIAAFVGSSRSSLNEVQNVSLVGFGGTDSFKLRSGGTDSAAIVRGTNYTSAAVDAAIEGITGSSVTVTGFAGRVFGDGGFQVTFNNTLDHDLLEVVERNGLTAVVGETDRGGAPTNGGALEATGNNAPNVSAPAGFTIPVRTPFALTATGSDPDGDTVTYLWEQNNNAPNGSVGTALFSNTKNNGPLFRIFGTPLKKPPYVPGNYNNTEGVNAPTTNPTRVFPDLAQILAGNTNAATGDCPPLNVDCFSEFLPKATYAGPLSFRVTARDGKAGGGGVATADTTLTLATGAGPFRVTSHGDGSPRVAGASDTVTWNVAGTLGAPVSAASVRISLSLDSGLTYPHQLAASTPNDGSHDVTLPETAAAAARIKVDAVGNVFFALSEADFELVEDTGLPVVAIDSGPSGQIGSRTPTFTFSSEPGATFECRVDGAPFAACTSPHTIAAVSAGAHVFRVRAIDEELNVGLPASRSFTYVLPPTTKIGKRTLKHAARTATFRFTGTGGIGARTFQCRLTGTKTTAAQRAWSKCAAPKTYKRLKRASYTFHVRARDAKGRVDPTPAKNSFRIRRA